MTFSSEVFEVTKRLVEHHYKPITALKQVINAIEGGQKSEDRRGIVYKQEFGQAFIDYLKEVIKRHESQRDADKIKEIAKKA